MFIRTLLTTLALTACTAFAQSPAKHNPEPLVQNMTCGDLLFMLGDEKQTQESTYLMFWAYGLKTGAGGIDLTKNPFTADGLKVFVRDLYDICKVKSDAKVIDVLAGKAVK
jgi:hypothetical protein